MQTHVFKEKLSLREFFPQAARNSKFVTDHASAQLIYTLYGILLIASRRPPKLMCKPLWTVCVMKHIMIYNHQSILNDFAVLAGPDGQVNWAAAEWPFINGQVKQQLQIPCEILRQDNGRIPE